jgi:hypothetical protein
MEFYGEVFPVVVAEMQRWSMLVGLFLMQMERRCPAGCYDMLCVGPHEYGWNSIVRGPQTLIRVWWN